MARGSHGGCYDEKRMWLFSWVKCPKQVDKGGDETRPGVSKYLRNIY